METNERQNTVSNDIVDIVGLLESGWQIYRKSWKKFSGASFLFLLIFIGASLIHDFIGLLFMGPMTAGIFLFTGEMIAGKDPQPSRVFEGFRWFLPSAIANLVISVFVILGLWLLLIPGFVFGGWYLLTYLFIIDRGFDFWSAMESSRRVAFRDMLGMTLFYVALGAINVIGALLFGIGILITFPVTTIATYLAYEKMVGVESIGKGEEPVIMPGSGETNFAEPVAETKSKAEGEEQPGQ